MVEGRVAGGAVELAARPGGEVDLERFGAGADKAAVAEEVVVEFDPGLQADHGAVLVQEVSVLSWIDEAGAASSSVAVTPS